MWILFIFSIASGNVLTDWQKFGQISANDPRLAGPAISDNLIDQIMDTKPLWKAGHNEHFSGATLKDAKYLCGTLQNIPEENDEILPVKIHQPIDLPTDFDWRSKMGDKCPSLLEVRDQANCGSCWAFGSVEAMTDRICIHSNASNQVQISAQDATSCCHLGDMGCNGGIPMTVYTYYHNTGIVTGGLYDDKTGCYAYELPPCAHHVNSTKYPPCGESTKTPKCANKCDSSATVWSKDKHHGATTYNLKSVENMTADIYMNGPITAQFFVHQDFLSYSSGVYHHTGIGPMLGGHAIKIIGWGVESGVDYWWVANSWNEDWGDHGFFKIRKGTNECQIENFALNGGPVAGLPKL